MRQLLLIASKRGYFGQKVSVLPFGLVLVSVKECVLTEVRNMRRQLFSFLVPLTPGLLR